MGSEERHKRILFEVERNKSRQSLNLSWKDRDGNTEEKKSMIFPNNESW